MGRETSGKIESVMESQNILSWKGATRIKMPKFRALHKVVIRSETQITDTTAESGHSTSQVSFVAVLLEFLCFQQWERSTSLILGILDTHHTVTGLAPSDIKPHSLCRA